MKALSPTSAWQEALAAAVADPARAVPDELALPAGSRGARLAVYRNNALVPLVQALEETLPACRRLLGTSLLREALLRFVRAHPPTSPVLQDYGNALPEFLAQAPAGRHCPAAPDLARLELLVVRCWHAGDAPLLQSADFAQLLAEPDRLGSLRFAWHPAAALFCSAHPVATLWLAAQPGARPAAAANPPSPASPALAGQEASGAAAPTGEAVLVTRSDWAVHVRKLDAAQAALAMTLHDGGTLEDALAAALDKHPAADSSALLALLIEGGFASAVMR